MGRLLRDQVHFVGDLAIVGDEAWTREEWAVAERQREQRREYEHRPVFRARRAEYKREYRRRTSPRASLSSPVIRAP